MLPRTDAPAPHMPDATALRIRPARAGDADALWRILAPTIRAGETYALPAGMSREAALAYWTGPDRETFGAEAPRTPGEALGTYYLRASQLGGGAHVANCGYMTGAWAAGGGVARAMCEHSLAHVRSRGFRARQFNFVVSTNEHAVRLWQRLGFDVVGRLPHAFPRPRGEYVDALVLFRAL
ncbi:acetyltransferase [Gemmatimonadetes bacterium T265]|nr:acetyltransferase [Gemmatimonadetes bacterium T265]